MTTTETALSIRNPFRADQLRKEMETLRDAIAIIDNACDTKLNAFKAESREEMVRKIRLLSLHKHATLSDELNKPSLIRFYGQTKDDESWRAWVVLTKEASAALEKGPVHPQWNDEIPAAEAAAMELWQALGFSCEQSPQSDYSPTGRWYQNAPVTYMVAGHRVIVQSGGLDV